MIGCIFSCQSRPLVGQIITLHILSWDEGHSAPTTDQRIEIVQIVDSVAGADVKNREP